MRPRRTLLVLLLWTGLVAGLSAQAPPKMRVQPLARDGQVFVTFELTGAFTEPLRETIHSGLPTSFTYDLELRRGVPAWIDRTLAVASVTASVQYDNLTRRHQLSLSVDGRVEDARVTLDEAEVERWLTSVERLALFRTATLEPNAEYYVRVRVRTRPKSTWSMWPFGGGFWGQARFTFIP